MSGTLPLDGHVGEQLSAYLDGELPEAERVKVEAHVRDCVPCSQWLDELQAVDGCAQEMAVEAPAGYFEAFPGRVRARLVARRRPRVPVWTWAAAAAVLLAVITPLTLRERAASPARSDAGLQAKMETAPAAPPLRATPTLPQEEVVVTTAPTTAPGAREKLRTVAPPVAPPAPAAVQQNQARLAERDDLTVRSYGYAQRGRDEQAAAKKETEAETRDDSARAAEGFARQARPQDAPGQAAAGAAIPTPTPPPPPPPAAAPAAAPATAIPEGVEGAKRAEVGGLADAKPEPKTKPDTEQGVGLRRKGAVSTVTGAGGRDSFEEAQAPSKDFDALAAREAASADESRRLYRDWSAFAARHRGTAEGDEARVRALEALAAAWRLGGAPADRTLARALAEAYVKEPGPQKARVRALLDELSR